MLMAIEKCITGSSSLRHVTSSLCLGLEKKLTVCVVWMMRSVLLTTLLHVHHELFHPSASQNLLSFHLQKLLNLEVEERPTRLRCRPVLGKALQLWGFIWNSWFLWIQPMLLQTASLVPLWHVLVHPLLNCLQFNIIDIPTIYHVTNVELVQTRSLDVDGRSQKWKNQQILFTFPRFSTSVTLWTLSTSELFITLRDKALTSQHRNVWFG